MTDQTQAEKLQAQGFQAGHLQTDIGGDTKYGRLYTADDIDKLVRWLTNGTIEGDGAGILAQAESEGVSFRFPADEPLFLLRGQDADALPTIEHYGIGSSDWTDAQMQKVGESVVAFRRFANEHPGRVKTPDA